MFIIIVILLCSTITLGDKFYIAESLASANPWWMDQYLSIIDTDLGIYNETTWIYQTRALTTGGEWYGDVDASTNNYYMSGGDTSIPTWELWTVNPSFAAKQLPSWQQGDLLEMWVVNSTSIISLLGNGNVMEYDPTTGYSKILSTSTFIFSSTYVSALDIVSGNIYFIDKYQQYFVYLNVLNIYTGNVQKILISVPNFTSLYYLVFSEKTNYAYIVGTTYQNSNSWMDIYQVDPSTGQGTALTGKINSYYPLAIAMENTNLHLFVYSYNSSGKQVWKVCDLEVVTTHWRETIITGAPSNTYANYYGMAKLH